jgi:hypothetical protein
MPLNKFFGKTNERTLAYGWENSLYATEKYSSCVLCHKKCKFVLYAKGCNFSYALCHFPLDAAGCRQWAISGPHVSVGRGENSPSSSTAPTPGPRRSSRGSRRASSAHTSHPSLLSRGPEHHARRRCALPARGRPRLGRSASVSGGCCSPTKRPRTWAAGRERHDTEARTGGGGSGVGRCTGRRGRHGDGAAAGWRAEASAAVGVQEQAEVAAGGDAGRGAHGSHAAEHARGPH